MAGSGEKLVTGVGTRIRKDQEEKGGVCKLRKGSGGKKEGLCK